MKTKKQNEKKSGMVVLYFNGEPITIQSPDAFKLRLFLAQVSAALTDSSDYYRANQMPDLATAQSDLKNIVHHARCSVIEL